MPEELSTVNEEPCEPLSPINAHGLPMVLLLARSQVDFAPQFDDLYWDLAAALRVLQIPTAAVQAHLRQVPLPPLGTPPRPMVSTMDLLLFVVWASPLQAARDFTAWLWQEFLPEQAQAATHTGSDRHPTGR